MHENHTQHTDLDERIPESPVELVPSFLICKRHSGFEFVMNGIFIILINFRGHGIGDNFNDAPFVHREGGKRIKLQRCPIIDYFLSCPDI